MRSIAARREIPIRKPGTSRPDAVLTYLLRRLGLAIITVFAITLVTFVILHLPPVDFVTAYAAQAAASGSAISAAEADAMRLAYGLNEPLWVQYWKWLSMVAVGDFGRSFEYGRPVTEVIGDRLWLTILLSIGAIIVTWGLALPIGIYSAVRQYSAGDYIFTFLAFIGLAIPSFLLALIVMYAGLRLFNTNVGGLFSSDYQLAPWSWGDRDTPVTAMRLWLRNSIAACLTGITANSWGASETDGPSLAGCGGSNHRPSTRDRPP